jgi:hypothetical protein
MEAVTEQEDEFRKCECVDEMVSGNLTDGELVTVEEWNRLVDEQDELRARWLASQRPVTTPTFPITGFGLQSR